MALARADSAAQPSGDARAPFASANAAAGYQTAAVPESPPRCCLTPQQDCAASLLGSPVKPVPANWSGRRAQPREPLTCNSQPGNWLLEGS